MPSKSNEEMLVKASASIEQSNGVYIIDYHGLSVKETQELRRALRAAGAQMKVYKNNIVKLALQNAEMPDVEEMLAGPRAYVFYDEDPVAAAKAIKEQATKLKKLEFIGAIADGKKLSAEEAKAYADLPSKEELLAKLVYVVASPLSGIAQVCAGPARGLATALQAVVDKKNAA